MAERKTAGVILAVYVVVIATIGLVVYGFYTSLTQQTSDLFNNYNLNAIIKNVPNNITNIQSNLIEVQINASKDIITSQTEKYGSQTAMYLTFLIVFILIVSIVITYCVNKILNKAYNDEKVNKIVSDYFNLSNDLMKLAKEKKATENEIKEILDRQGKSADRSGNKIEYKRLLENSFDITKWV
jgi:predicted PurR-regulated permease PerM